MKSHTIHSDKTASHALAFREDHEQSQNIKQYPTCVIFSGLPGRPEEEQTLYRQLT